MMDYELETNDADKYSVCRCKKFINAYITDRQGIGLNGEKKLDSGIIVRFKNGLIDGGDLPAVEYEDGGTEYWHNGVPDGMPAIITDFGSREEYWIQGRLVKIRSIFEIEEIKIEK